MIQSDALSRRPDHCVDNGEEEEVVLLPKELFVNILDMELQDRIVEAKDLDYDVSITLETLLGKGPGSPENPIIIEDSDSDEGFPYRRCTYCKGDHLHPYCPVLVTFPEHPSLRFDPDFLPSNPVAST